MKTFACLFFVSLLHFSAVSEGVTNKVLIIGIDGTRCDSLAAARTPNLNALTSNGCYSVRAITHPVTHSAACWSSFFTGVWGDKHLVNDPGNSFSGNALAAYPSFFKRLEADNTNFNTICFARWAPLITVVPDADVKQSFSTDQAITDETCRRLTNSNPDVLYMILLDVDSAGHSYGWAPTVTNYVKAIETADRRVGQIMNALTNRATYALENWLVLCLTDHGEHDHPNPELSRITWHIVSGPSAARGVMWPSPSIVDMCATVLTHMGVEIDPAWNLDARVEGFPLRPTAYGSNLIFNGDAEWSSGSAYYTTNRGIAWWFDIASTTIGSYGANPEFPALGPVPESGRNFFLGGTVSGTISQRIDISDAASDVDGPGVEYALSGYFGGAGAEEDSASLTARFLDATAAPLGTNTVGSVTAAQRGGLTAMVSCSTNGLLPAGTRFVEFILANTRVTGVNDASADLLSCVLTPTADGPFPITSQEFADEGFTVQFLTVNGRSYLLERRASFESPWQEASAAIAGTGLSASLSDTNAPGEAMYYRVRCFRP